MTADVAPEGQGSRSALNPAEAARKAARRRMLASRMLLSIVGAMTLMTVVLFFGLRLDDASIRDHHGTATATVLSISALHTGIEFVDAAGVAVRPRDGVLYPGLLTVGQRFMAEYSTIDPTVVRVGGRTAAVGNAGLAMTLAGTWLIGGAALWVLRRPGGRAYRAPLPR